VEVVGCGFDQVGGDGQIEEAVGGQGFVPEALFKAVVGFGLSEVCLVVVQVATECGERFFIDRSSAMLPQGVGH